MNVSDRFSTVSDRLTYLFTRFATLSFICSTLY
jgi:hypothetical protein